MVFSRFERRGRGGIIDADAVAAKLRWFNRTA